MNRFFSFFALLFLVKTAAAQVSAKATMDSTHMLIGDQMRLRIEVSAAKDAVIQPLSAGMSADSTIEFLAESKWDTLQKSGDNLRLRKDLVFTAWDSGYLRVPAIPLVFSQDGNRDTTFTRDIPIRVDLPVADTTLADIKPIIGEPATWQDFIGYIVAVAALALVIVLVVLLRKRKAQPVRPAQKPAVPLPPHEVALQKLATLKQQQLWQNGQVKEYHSELTYIVREYLENRYGILALEQTTDEILTQLRQQGFGASLSEKLADLLETADLVKFAKAQPTAEFHERAMDIAQAFILETKPAPALAGTTETKDVH
ncbi:MAG: hypothetical protein HY842_12100 [Bacteroidetes bacterium]|nr:hypothetical protein [Bacteroidota bacterium]